MLSYTTSNMFRAIIMGAPGSGKGTIAKRIVSDFDMKFLSSGDVLRNEILQKTDVGAKCEEYMRRGALVPDDIFDTLILRTIKKMEGQCWLLDGFPRTAVQAQVLEENKLMPNVVIDLIVPFEIIIERVKDRWIHGASGRVYNLKFSPPKRPGVDDVTGERLEQRIDDMPETVLARLEAYKQQTLPIAEFFRKRGLLAEFEGCESNQIWPKVRQHLVKMRKPVKESKY